MGSGDPEDKLSLGFADSVDRHLMHLIAAPSVTAGEQVRRLVINSSALSSLPGIDTLPGGGAFATQLSQRGGRPRGVNLAIADTCHTHRRNLEQLAGA